MGTLIWLPLCLAAWYYLSPILAPWLALPAQAVLTTFLPALITGIETLGPNLEVVTTLPTQTGQISGVLVFVLNPLKYSYSLPLYTALVLAVTVEDDWDKLLGWLLGVMILSAAAVAGISVEIVKILSFELGDQARAQLNFSQWHYDLTVLGYHSSTLILPSVLPVMLWLGQFGGQWMMPKPQAPSPKP